MQEGRSICSNWQKIRITNCSLQCLDQHPHWFGVEFGFVLCIEHRPGLSLLDAGLPRKDSEEEKKAEKDLWTAPSYFNITLCGVGDDFGARSRHLGPIRAFCMSSAQCPNQIMTFASWSRQRHLPGHLMHILGVTNVSAK